MLPGRGVEVVALTLLVGCRFGFDTATLEIAPADLDLTVVNGVLVTQPFAAILVSSDGERRDVTEGATFELRDPGFGAWDRETLGLTGVRSGETEILANAGGLTGATSLIVRTHLIHVDPDLAPEIIGLFDAAVEDPSSPPALLYPTDAAVLPRGLGALDVHWADATHDVFHLSAAGAYATVDVYTHGSPAGNGRWTALSRTDLAGFLSPEPIGIVLAGLAAASPMTKSTSTALHASMTREDARGAMCARSSAPLPSPSEASLFCYDLATAEIAPAPLFPAGEPAPCIGCHTLSRDGRYAAFTFDGSGGRGGVMDLATRTFSIPIDGLTQPVIRWDFSAFTPKADKLAAVDMPGTLTLRASQTGDILLTVPASSDSRVTTPEFSPDGRWLAAVSTASSDGGTGAVPASGGSIVVWSFDDATNTLGAQTTLVPADRTSPRFAYYPTWSPDGAWIAYIQTQSTSYVAPEAELWVVKADGSLPPIQLTQANATSPAFNGWPRWMPEAATFGVNREPLMFVSFGSRRAFGVRQPMGNVVTQIWIAAFFPQRALAGQDPSSPAIWMPIQDVTQDVNGIQWTARLYR